MALLAGQNLHEDAVRRFSGGHRGTTPLAAALFVQRAGPLVRWL
ncbi:hypothetical protein ACFDTO_06500 [Microbacteriaceae bacterium 4G12]